MKNREKKGTSTIPTSLIDVTLKYLPERGTKTGNTVDKSFNQF